MADDKPEMPDKLSTPRQDSQQKAGGKLHCIFPTRDDKNHNAGPVSQRSCFNKI